jgi:hypothetical protein
MESLLPPRVRRARVMHCCEHRQAAVRHAAFSLDKYRDLGKNTSAQAGEYNDMGRG